MGEVLRARAAADERQARVRGPKPAASVKL